MAQSGRNVEYAAGMTSSSTPMSMDSGSGSKNTGSTTMPGISQGKVGVGNADRGGMGNPMGSYTAPSAGSMAPSATKVKAPSNSSTSRMGGFRMGGMIGWGGGYGGIGMSRMD